MWWRRRRRRCRLLKPSLFEYFWYLSVVCAPFLVTAVVAASLALDMNMHALLVIYSCVYDFFSGLFLWNVSHFNGVKEYISTAKIPWRPLHGWLLMLLLWIPLPFHSLLHLLLCLFFSDASVLYTFALRFHSIAWIFTEKFIHQKWITNIAKEAASKMKQHFTTK